MSCEKAIQECVRCANFGYRDGWMWCLLHDTDIAPEWSCPQFEEREGGPERCCGRCANYLPVAEGFGVCRVEFARCCTDGTVRVTAPGRTCPWPPDIDPFRLASEGEEGR